MTMQLNRNKAHKFRFMTLNIQVLSIVTLLLLMAAWSQSYTYNENGRLASGLFYLRFGDYSIFHVNPPLINTVSAVPAIAAGAACADRNDIGFSSFGRHEYEAGTLFDQLNESHRLLICSGRSLCILLVVLCFPSYFKYSATVFGLGAASVALCILLFSPWILGYTPLILPDVPSALFAILALYTFTLWLKEPNWDHIFIAGLALGLAELTKFTLIVFYPMFIVMWLIRRGSELKTIRANAWIQEVKQLFLMFAVSLLVINMGYVFEGTGKQLRSFKFQTTLFTGCKTLDTVPSGGGNRFDSSGNVFETALGYLPMPLPSNYIQGIDTQRLDFERGIPSYLRGQWSEHGWWYYYLYALLIKTPVGTILLFFLAIFCTLFLKGYNASWREEMVILLPGIVLLAFVSSQTGFSIHSRYIIPALPFFFVWMSKVGRAFTGAPNEESSNKHVSDDAKSIKVNSISHKMYPQGYKTVRVLTILFLTWSVLSSLSVYPHSISYFNELAVIIPTPKTDGHPQIPPVKKPTNLYSWYKTIISAGPRNGPRHLLDSNIDWGQDLFNLEQWCKAHSEVEHLKVAYWGSYPIEMTTIPNCGSPPAKPEPGWYAISVNNIYSQEGTWRYFLDYTPVAMAGYSIYIYHITQADIDTAKQIVHKEASMDNTSVSVLDECRVNGVKMWYISIIEMV